MDDGAPTLDAPAEAETQPETSAYINLEEGQGEQAEDAVLIHSTDVGASAGEEEEIRVLGEELVFRVEAASPATSPTLRPSLGSGLGLRPAPNDGGGEESNSTISTMETSGVVGDTDFDGVKAESGSKDEDELSAIQGDSATLDWLNNQVAVAISSGLLEVTCKQLTGKLHLDKFGSGNRGKCISGYDQRFTPTEFEAFAGRAQCKDWKRSIRFHGRPLLQLIELDVLKVHAVSCTCSACFNGESSGAVRLHDTKRKTSSFTSTLARRPSNSTPGKGLGDVDEPLLKQIRLEVGRSKAVNPSASVSASSSAESVASTSSSSSDRPRILQSPNGSLRLLPSASAQGGQHVVTAQTPSGQTVTLLLPSAKPAAATPIKIQASPPKMPQAQTVSYIPLSKAKGVEASGGRISLGGITYTPVQMSAPPRPVVAVPSSGVNIVSAELSDHWAVLDETVKSLQLEVNSLRELVTASRTKTDAALQQLYAQTQATAGAELNKLKTALRAASTELSRLRRGDEGPRSPESKYCCNCNRPARMACGDCQDAFYCGDFCVRRDSAAHRLSCRKGVSTVTTHTID